MSLIYENVFESLSFAMMCVLLIIILYSEDSNGAVI